MTLVGPAEAGPLVRVVDDGVEAGGESALARRAVCRLTDCGVH